MGNTFPLLSKEIVEHDVFYYESAACSTQGHRDNMEDAIVCMTRFPKFPNQWFAGVFDGHCGAGMSFALSRQLMASLNEAPDLTDESITKVCVAFDQKFVRGNEGVPEKPGSACVFAIVTRLDSGEFEIKACNVGDSRIVLVNPMEDTIEALTVDHKPSRPDERARIVAAGGFVQMDRVNGSLALSRAFGDPVYKNSLELPYEEQKVTAVPEFLTVTVPAGCYLMVACDGLFEVTETEDMGSRLLKGIKQNLGVAELAQDLVNLSFQAGSNDNMSAYIIKLRDTPVATQRTVDYYIPVPLFTRASVAHKRNFYNEIAAMGLDPVDVLRKVGTHNADSASSAQNQILAQQLNDWKRKRILLPHQRKEGDAVILPRDETLHHPKHGQGTDEEYAKLLQELQSQKQGGGSAGGMAGGDIGGHPLAQILQMLNQSSRPTPADDDEDWEEEDDDEEGMGGEATKGGASIEEVKEEDEDKPVSDKPVGDKF